jgi:uncharacterized protein (UPF0276 family)
MKLAVNFSDSLLLLLKESPGLRIDYIKLPTIPFPGCWSQFNQGRNYRKLLPHLAQPGILDLCHPRNRQNFNEPIITQIINQTAPPYLSTHLEATVEYFPEVKPDLHLKNRAVATVLKNRILHNIHRVKARINIPLILENNPYYSWYWYFRMNSEPEFITELCESGDCGLLLDIAHAQISAWYLKMDVLDYLCALPLSLVKEVHISGLLEAPVGIWDSHTVLHEQDYQLLEYILKKTQPEIVTIEYGGYPDREWNPLKRYYEECLRNNPDELREMIAKVLALIDQLSGGEDSDSNTSLPSSI